jgi:predicted Zn-dependent peptidase
MPRCAWPPCADAAPRGEISNERTWLRLKIPSASLLLAALLAWQPPARAADAIAPPEIVTLKNGIGLLLSPDPQAKAVNVTVWYDAGSRYDKPERTGVAHLFEHLMFDGSAHVAAGQHASLVRGEGGSSGGYVTSDFVAFYQTLPPDALELAFRLEADRMTGLKLTQASLDTERNGVPGERDRRSTPLTRGLQRLYALAFPSSPYGVSVFGRESDLPRLTLKDLDEFYRRQFVPSRARVSVVGNFRRDDALALARKYLEPIRGASTKAAAPIVEKQQTSQRRDVGRGGTPVRVVLVGWRMPPRTDRDWPVLNLLVSQLTRGSAAPLSRALTKDRPLCLSVQGDVESRRDGSLLYLAAALAPNADSAEVERTLLTGVEAAARAPVPDDDLERAKREAEIALWYNLQTTPGRAQALGMGWMLAGDPTDYQHQLERIRSASSQDLQRVAARLGPSERNVVWLVPAASDTASRTPGSRP